MGVISRLGCGEGLRDCEYGGGRGRRCVINADHRIVDIHTISIFLRVTAWP